MRHTPSRMSKVPFLALGLMNFSALLYGFQDANAQPKTDASQWVTSVILDPSGTQLWATSAQGLLLRPGQVLRATLDATPVATNIYETGASAWAIAVVPEANTLLSVDYKGKLLRSEIANPGATTAVEVPLRWSRTLLPVGDSRVLAGSEDGKIVDIHLPDGAVVGQWDAHGAAVHSLALSPDKSILASGAGDGTIKLWNRSNNTEVKAMSFGKAAIWDIVFTRDGTHLIAADADRRLNIFDVAAGKLKMTLQILPDWATSLAMHPTENVIAVGCMNGSVHFYDLNSYRRVGAWNGVGSGVWDILFVPDGSRVIAATRKNGLQVVGSDVWSAPLTAARAEAANEQPPAPAPAQ